MVPKHLSARRISLGLWFGLCFLGSTWITPAKPASVLQIRDELLDPSVDASVSPNNMLLSPDGRTLLLSWPTIKSPNAQPPGRRGSILFAWDVLSESVLWKLDHLEGNLEVIQFTPDGNHLAIGDDDEENLKIIDVASGASRPVDNAANWLYGSLRSSPDSRIIAFQAKYRDDAPPETVFWSLETNHELGRIPGYIPPALFSGYSTTLRPDIISSEGFAKDGKRVVSQDRLEIPVGLGSGYNVMRVMLWNIAEASHPVLEKGHIVPYGTVAVASDQSSFVVSCTDRGHFDESVALIYEVGTGKLNLKFQFGNLLKSNPVPTLSQFGTLVLMDSIVIDPEDFEHSRFTIVTGAGEYKVISPRESNSFLSPELKWIAVQDSGGARIVSAETGLDHANLCRSGDLEDSGTVIYTSTGGKYGGTSFQFANNDRLCLVDGILADSALSQLSEKIPYLGSLFSRNYGPVARVWDVEKKREILTCPGASQAVIARDGKRVAAYQDDCVTIWNLPPDKAWARIVGGAAAIWTATVALCWMSLWTFRRMERTVLPPNG